MELFHTHTTFQSVDILQIKRKFIKTTTSDYAQFSENDTNNNDTNNLY